MKRGGLGASLLTVRGFPSQDDGASASLRPRCAKRPWTQSAHGACSLIPGGHLQRAELEGAEASERRRGERGGERRGGGEPAVERK